MGGPWPLRLSVVLGGRTAAVCQGSQVLLDLLDAGSRCAQISPTSCVSACGQHRKTSQNSRLFI